jgi:hypothetical protein
VKTVDKLNCKTTTTTFQWVHMGPTECKWHHTGYSSNSWHQLHNSENEHQMNWHQIEVNIPQVFNWQWTARTTSYQLLQWTASAKALHDSFCSGSYLRQLLFLLGRLL